VRRREVRRREARRPAARGGQGRPVSAPAPLLEASGVNAWYGTSHVLHGVDLSVGRGEAVGLLGRNGMGKSTLIRAILGHVAQRAGRIAIDGRDLSRGRPHQLARLGVAYVPEGRGVFPGLRVREQLTMAARPAPPGRAAWTLERVLATFPRLAGRLGHRGEQLSGGEQQMLAIGRALTTQPVLLLLDEATEGLAPQVVAEIWRVVDAIRADGIATLVVDRDYRRVAARTDRLVVLVKGRVALAGPSAALRADPALQSLLGV
jgi:branched-chain amino acid transport system ATP-binding protein